MRQRSTNRTPATPAPDLDPADKASRRDFLKAGAVGLAAAAVPPTLNATGLPASVFASGVAHDRESRLVVQKQGSFAAGGSVLQAPGVFDSTSATPQGQTLHGDHVYVQFQIPPDARRYPLVLWHGGGQSGMCWESTVDGREGYQSIFLRRGYAVYIIDQPRRGRAGNSTQGITLTPTPADQELFVAWRLGLWPHFYPNTKFPQGAEALNQFFRLMTVNTGPSPQGLVTDGAAAALARIGPAVLVTHSASGILGWITAIKSANVKAIYAYEPTSYVFPQGEVPPPMGGQVGQAVPLADFLKLTRIPIVMEYSDGIPTGDTPSPYPRVENWRNRLKLGKLMVDALNHRGGDAQILHLPEVGLHGNTHFPFADVNNLEVADLLSRWLHEKKLDKRGKSK
jgi:hypothetical protein